MAINFTSRHGFSSFPNKKQSKKVNKKGSDVIGDDVIKIKLCILLLLLLSGLRFYKTVLRHCTCEFQREILRLGCVQGVLRVCQISFKSVGITVTRFGRPLNKKKILKRDLTDFIKRCYVTQGYPIDVRFCGFIAFRECYVCAKYRLNRWG